MNSQIWHRACPRIPPAAEVGNGDAVSAAVGVCLRVERLVQVADEMNEEAQGIGALGSGRGLIFQDGELIQDRLGNATVRAAGGRDLAARRPERNIQKMPGGGRLALRRGAEIIGPGGSVGEVVETRRAAETPDVGIDRIILQESEKHLLGGGSEMFFGEHGDRLMPLAAPSVGGRRTEEADEGPQQLEDESGSGAFHEVTFLVE